MISNLKISKIASVLSALWNNSDISCYVADVHYRPVCALCMPVLAQIHAHNPRLIGAHLLSFSEFNLVKLCQQLLDQGLTTQLRAQLALAEKTSTQCSAEELLREFESGDTTNRVR